MRQLGDYAEDATLVFSWGTNNADGASLTRATDGEVRVYKDDGVAQSTEGITDTEDFDSLTGVHNCKIDLSAHAFYATGHDYHVVLTGAVIDGQTVNAVLARFSIGRGADYAEDATVYWLWSSHDGDGASITRAADGTVQVYKDDGDTESVAGITDTEDFDSLTGVHLCKIDTSADAFYASGHDYSIVLAGATVDGQTVNAPIGHFSTENRQGAPSEPTLAVTSDGDGDAVTCVVTGDDAATHTIYYRKVGAGSWTEGSSDTGDASIAQAGLDDHTFYWFVCVASDGDYNSVPSVPVGLFVSSGVVHTYEILAVIDKREVGHEIELLCVEIDD